MALLLARGGLAVNFKGKGLNVILLTIIPQTIEVAVVGLLSYGVFEMPLIYSFCLAYSMATMVGSIIIPAMI